MAINFVALIWWLSTYIAIAQIFHELTPEYTTILGISIGDSSFEEVKKRFGEAKPFEQEKECCTLYYLCYKSESSTDNIVVVFEIDERLYPVESIAVAQYDAVSDLLTYAPGSLKVNIGDYCVESNKIPKNINVGDLSVGITKEQVNKIIGKPEYYSHVNMARYDFYRMEKMSNEWIARLKKRFSNVEKYPSVRIQSSIEVHFKQDKLVGFRISNNMEPSR